MKPIQITSLSAALVLAASCTMKNPLIEESPLPYGAPQFDKIKTEHYIPAFEEGIRRARTEIDRIGNNPEAPTFENTILALEESGELLSRVSGIFYNLLEADSNEQMQQIAEDITPMMNDYSMYVSLNDGLFQRVKTIYENRESLGLDRASERLLDKTYQSFVRGGANLNPEDKELFSKLNEELSLTSLQFSKNVLEATNSYTLNITDETRLAGLPEYVRAMGRSTAEEKGVEGWVFDLSQPSYSAFMKFSDDEQLRKEFYMAYNSKAFGGPNDNSDVCLKLASLRLKYANILGYRTYADYALENRMAKNIGNVRNLMDALMGPSLPAARAELDELLAFARQRGYTQDVIQPWDFSYWSEKQLSSLYSVSDEILKPYFPLDACINAVFGLASKLYGISFEERSDLPVYHKDVKVYDVKDADGSHLALFYADFFPRASKRAGAWMTEFRGQSIRGGVEYRPHISIVTNFSKPAGDTPALLTHYELTTFLHEFGHALHGILAKGSYESLTGTNVARDFVELPSQIMENWGYEPEYLKSFARHYSTGEMIPDELIAKLAASKNFHSAYLQVRQLHFGYLDLAYHTIQSEPKISAAEIEKRALQPYLTLPAVDGTLISTAFSHIFSGGYSAGYYSYKWAEVLEADAYSLFKEKGIFSHEAADAFRTNILEKGSSEDEAVLYRNFRGHDPQPQALLEKLGITGK